MQIYLAPINIDVTIIFVSKNNQDILNSWLAKGAPGIWEIKL